MRKLRSLFLPAAICVLLGLGFAWAQTFTRALQLSQDTTGAFSVDTNNGVYFPGHILSTGTGQPAPTVSGTGTPSIAGTDVAGTVTMGTSATTASVVFGRTYLSVPNCVVSWQSVNNTAISYSVVANGITMNQPSTSGNKVNYFCTSAS